MFLLLKQKAYQVYEKLAVLAHVEEYIATTPNADTTKEALTKVVMTSFDKKEGLTDDTKNQPVIEEQPFDELQELMFSEPLPEHSFKNDVKDIGQQKSQTLEEELKDTIPVDVIADLFEEVPPKKSLNDALHATMQIGLNDRIAFVKNLFDNSQEEFNRVVSQLNTFKTAKEAKRFINKVVKPAYDWSDKETLEVRFVELLERRFS